MNEILLLCGLLLVLVGAGVAAATWHHHHPARAHRGVRRWWAGKGWSWSAPAYLGVHLVVSLALTVATLLAFAQISDLVTDHAAITRFDVQFDTRLHAEASPTGIRFATMLSLIGGPPAMALLAAAGAAYLAFIHRDRDALLTWVAATVGGGILDLALKTAYRRPRPLFADPIAHGYGFSFPSGHAMGSLIGFGMLAYILARHRTHTVTKLVIAAAATALTVAVGASRLYLGVHFPSDVLAGFSAGLMWLMGCISALEIAQGRHAGAHAAPGSVGART